MTQYGTVAFFHIPKTAGTTLSTLFERLYADRPRFLAGRSGSTHIEDCAAFLALPEQVRAGFGYVSGHIEIPVLDAIPGSRFAFTFLRNPVDRLRSLYAFVKRTPTHHLHSWIANRNATLVDFILYCNWDELHNGMTRRLAGVSLARGNDPALLRRAIVNIHRYFGFIGLQESFDKSLFCLGGLLGVEAHRLAYTKKNVNPDARLAALSPADKSDILSCNELDVELYGYCRRLFEQRAKALCGPSSDKQFKAFKKMLKSGPKRQ